MREEEGKECGAAALAGVRKRMQIEQQQPATVAAAQMLVSSAPEHLWYRLGSSSQSEASTRWS